MLRLILLLLALSSCNQTGYKMLRLQFENADGSTSPVIHAEVANNDRLRTLGLMYRKTLAESAGMVFVFPEEGPLSFWMKNTYLELDIIYLSSLHKVVSIIERAVPHSEVQRPSEKPSQYVVEVRGGSAAKWGVRPGSLVKFLDPVPGAE